MATLYYNRIRELSPTDIVQGKIWVGDPCYILHDEWSDVCDAMFKEDMPAMVIPTSNGNIYLFKTYGGDGCYPGVVNDVGFECGVDSGMLAIIPANIKPGDSKPELGHITTIAKPCTVKYVNGDFSLMDGNSVILSVLTRDY